MFVIGTINNLLSHVSVISHIIPRNHQIFLWFCGLRGAVAFALSVTLLDNEHFQKDIRAVIFGSVMVIVFFTVVIQGSLTTTVLHYLGLDDSGQKKAAEMEESHERTRQSVGSAGGGTATPLPFSSTNQSHTNPAVLAHIKQASLSTLDEYMNPDENQGNKTQSAEQAREFMDTMNNGIWIKIYELDKRYIKPFFSTGSTRKKNGQRYDHLAPQKSHHLPKPASSLVEDSYEIQNLELASAVDGNFDEDSDMEDEANLNNPKHNFDNMSLADAAEHIGLAANFVRMVPADGVGIFAPPVSTTVQSTLFPAINETSSLDYASPSISGLKISTSHANGVMDISHKILIENSIQKRGSLLSRETHLSASASPTSDAFPVILPPSDATPQIVDSPTSLRIRSDVSLDERTATTTNGVDDEERLL